MKSHSKPRRRTTCAMLLGCFFPVATSIGSAQGVSSPHTEIQAVTPPTKLPELPDAPGLASVAGTVSDTDGAVIAGAQITLEDAASKSTLTIPADGFGEFLFASVPPGLYDIRAYAKGFAGWKVEGIQLRPLQRLVVPEITLGVEAIDTAVTAITVEEFAEQQITAEEHQRILGILPNFYVSYLGSNAQPLTRKQKFKLAVTVSSDPLTFLTTGISAGIQQAQGDFSGYGPGASGYVQRYASTYGTRIAATFLGAAVLPSLLHQDPRYFYNGHGTVVHRALYAIATTVICKGDNGHWQPNYSNVLGNLGAAGLASTWYPRDQQHSVQVTVTDTLLGVAEGAFGTLFQEFLLHRLTHGAPRVDGERVSPPSQIRSPN